MSAKIKIAIWGLGRAGWNMHRAELERFPDLFEIAGSGFGAVMMTTDLIRRCGGQPFFPVAGFGEDFSFCLRAREAGAKLYCDGRIKLDHIGVSAYNEALFLKQQREG